ncbi:LysR substrate-binding domain-containing protein [Prosthecomicrobium pneumaticum]|uniref:DNA-binding transcriptional LysR family regulator n=1 Tax=Prosthecomicrobium pneumaticum TaxID=81895 RepID=A0A7W9CV62_9HYPH|nr:LysR substrate-binding domain-containing protein [Prosthecomicrobium pneumaticum]MBB5752163.1 DNA-binding transcriptional LysR family regulator [Prosthecomicrobium pneumaticum]
MANVLDLDQLRTFVAIADTGSFTRAADTVHKTQSAVSMQMRRLEERIGKPIFGRDGRSAKLTEDGERLLGYARRLVRLSDETVAAFDEDELSGRVRLGTPDDYADRFLPEILARFSRSNPRVEVTVVCEPTVQLIECLRNGELDLGIITNMRETPQAEIIRHEPLYWVTSSHHRVEDEEVLPLALGRQTCCWRREALDALATMSRKYRILYASNNSTALSAAVLAGLAVSVQPESALRPGMRILGEADGFSRLRPAEIAIMRSWTQPANAIVDALAEHIVSSLDNLTMRIAAE